MKRTYSSIQSLPSKIVTRQFIFLFFLLNLLTVSSAFAGGGMYPVSQINRLNLAQKGLQIGINKIYNPDSTSLLNAIVRIGGCTGSFVSSDGLILTNHHCVFGALKRHSSEANNYMQDGFHASNHEQALPMKGQKVQIMVDYKDVSNEVLQGIDTIDNAAKRRSLRSQNVKKVEQHYSEQFPDLKVEVSEMMSGKSYLLFKYQIIKDLRIVYVPPRNVGEFGGSKDNWEWPRHTGDFSFVRAYVGPDGAPASYNENNVPFEPEQHLQVNKKGASRDDFVFMLGYPGTTYRHYSSDFIQYHREVILPYIEELYQWRLNQMEQLTKQSEKLKIKYDPKIKSLSNVAKNFRGKLKAMDRINLYESRKAEETKIIDSLEGSPELKSDFLATTKGLDTLYGNIRNVGYQMLWYYQFLRTSDAMKMARKVYAYAKKMQAQQEKGIAIDTLNHQPFAREIKQMYDQIDWRLDSGLTRHFLESGLAFEQKNRIDALHEYFTKDKPNKVRPFIKEVYEEKYLFDTTQLLSAIRENPLKLINYEAPMMKLWQLIKPGFHKVDSIRNKNFTTIDVLRTKYVNLKMQALDKNFVPDANSTLRFSYGSIKGYWPKDGVFNEPLASISGYKAKARQQAYDGYQPLVHKIDNTQTRNYTDPNTNDVPVCMLYNTDTTGGNSGSPVLDANGNLVGLNFDRVVAATINDYEWDNQYSRSIGVDIRFILWYLDQMGDADHLLKEMEVQ